MCDRISCRAAIWIANGLTDAELEVARAPIAKAYRDNNSIELDLKTVMRVLEPHVTRAVAPTNDWKAEAKRLQTGVDALREQVVSLGGTPVF